MEQKNWFELWPWLINQRETELFWYNSQWYYVVCENWNVYKFFRKLVANIHHPFSRKTKYVHSFSFCHVIDKGKKETLACGHNLQAHLLNHVTYLYYSSWNFLFKSSYFCLLNWNCWIWKWERRSSSMQMKSKSREKMRKLICERRG